MTRYFDFKIFWKNYGIIIIFCIYYLFLSFATDVFFTINNQLNVLRQISIHTRTNLFRGIHHPQSWEC